MPAPPTSRHTLVLVIGLSLAVFVMLAGVLVFRSPGNGETQTEGGLYQPPEEGLPDGYRTLLPRDAIEPVYDPEFVPADQAGWNEDNLVIGVAHDGEAKAYPVGFLNSREMVIDRISGTPILVSWCPVCATAMVHRRVLDGEEIVFGNQGDLFENAMTWWDHETGSVWSQPLGEAILGPLAGERVEVMSSRLTKWGVWMDDHPDTLALDAPGPRSGFTLRKMSIAVDVDGAAAAYPTQAVQAHGGVVNDTVGGTPVAVVIDPDLRERWAVFSRETPAGELTLQLDGGSLVDPDTGSAWDPVTGAALEGSLTTEVPRLQRVAAFTVFEKDFRNLWPDGRVWEG